MWVLYTSLRKAFDLKRTCPKCKHSQLIKLHMRGKPVTCKRCGECISPPKPHEQCW